MKASSWATATSRWWLAADRLSATFGNCTGTLTRRPMAHPLSLRGAFRMDMTWVTGRIAVGGGIWNAENMAAEVRAGVTHHSDIQMEFDSTQPSGTHTDEVPANSIADDFQPQPSGEFPRR